MILFESNRLILLQIYRKILVNSKAHTTKIWKFGFFLINLQRIYYGEREGTELRLKTYKYEKDEFYHPYACGNAAGIVWNSI
jgi:hypothetical protein